MTDITDDLLLEHARLTTASFRAINDTLSVLRDRITSLELDREMLIKRVNRLERNL